MNIVTRSYFTLLEILVVCAIIGVVGSFTAFNMHKAYQEQLALNEMNSVVQLFNTATDLMMLVNLDSEIRFYQKNDQFVAELVPKSGVSPLSSTLIPKDPLVFSHIDEIAFKDGYQKTVLKEPFSLLLMSKGFIMNRGVLTMKSGKLNGSIILYGYPTNVGLIKGTPPDFPEDKSLVDLITRITDLTRRETEEGAP